VKNDPISQLDLNFGSEFPTYRDPERAARAAAQAVSEEEQEPWCDSEAPTGVAAERPLFPLPPRAPRV
jgi:hypothetical protein